MKQTADLIGKYLNRYGYSDVNPIGKIIAVSGKQTVTVQRVEAGENLRKMEFVPGGFSAVCLNTWNQEYNYTETEETFNVRLSKCYLKTVRVDDQPYKYYDYNF